MRSQIAISAKKAARGKWKQKCAPHSTCTLATKPLHHTHTQTHACKFLHIHERATLLSAYVCFAQLSAVASLRCGCGRVRRAADIESCAGARLFFGCAHLLPATPRSVTHNFPVLRQIDTLCMWKGKDSLDRLTCSISSPSLPSLFAMLWVVLYLLFSLGASRLLPKHFISFLKKVALCFFNFCILFPCFVPACEENERLFFCFCC